MCRQHGNRGAASSSSGGAGGGGFIATIASDLNAHLERVRARVPPSAGAVASYIPQLAKADPETFGAALCSVNGELHSAGDDRARFSIQSCVKPFTYLMACDELGTERVHEYVGREPSGQAFNAFSLTETKGGHAVPFNPMINSGAIAVCSLLGQRRSPGERFSALQETMTAVATDGGRAKSTAGLADDVAAAAHPVHCGFDNATFMSERDTGFNNYALAHFMRARHDTSRALTQAVGPRSIEEDLELYFQACSVTVDVRAAAVMAATLAAGGRSPFSQTQRFAQTHVTSAVQLMFSCGMYNDSGAWACQVGLPAKSGVAGCILVVVPNVLGFAVLAPPLDATGSSVRGMALIEELAREYNLNVFSQLMLGDHGTTVSHLEEMHAKGVRGGVVDR